MGLETKWNGQPVGILEVENIPAGISDLSWTAYRSLGHLQMVDAFQSGLPIVLELSVRGKSTRLKLLSLTHNRIRIENQTDGRIRIRPAVPEDANFLTDLAYRSFWDAFHDHPKNAPDDLADYMAKAFSLEQTAVELADERNIFLIAEIGGEMAGYAKLTVGATEEGIRAERPIELNRLYSHQKFLGKGVGQTLMNDCFVTARELGCDVMWLGVWEYNPRAQRFYEKNGFSVCGKHVFQLGSDPQIDLLMARNLFSGQPER